MMITAIRSLSQVHGAGLWLAFWLVCLLLCLGICLCFRANRRAPGSTLLGLLAAEVVTDLIWTAVFYPDGSYANPGIGGAFTLLLWIPVLGLTAILVTALNCARLSSSEQDKPPAA